MAPTAWWLLARLAALISKKKVDVLLISYDINFIRASSVAIDAIELTLST